METASLIHGSLPFPRPCTVQLLSKLSRKICHSAKHFPTKGGHCLHFYSQSTGECLCRHPVYRKEKRKMKSLFYNYASQNGSQQPHEQINVPTQVHILSSYKGDLISRIFCTQGNLTHILCSLYF